MSLAKKKKVELLSPSGSFEALKYAINNGADAVYLAGKMFGARAFANNFDNDEMVEAIKYAHSYGVKVYVTVNTIIFENEIDDVIKFIDFLYLNGVDAVIVQDLGLASIIVKRYPDLDLHASTQMNIQTLEEAKVLKKIGFKRIVLGREVNVQEIKRIKENLDIEIEVFTHGALCISYSGNCLMSSLVGSRSGNRGKCAQPCRLEYSLDGKKKYYLSTRDLSLVNDLNEIYPYVDSLKIEGRMKNPSYVGVVTNLYKTQINNIELSKNVSIKEKFNDLKITFNRTFTKGFVLNDKNENITNCDSQNHLGVLIGKVVNVNGNNISVKLTNNIGLEIRDCLRIVNKKYEDAIIVNDMYVNHKLIKKAYPGQTVNLRVHKKLDVNDSVFITKSEVVEDKYNIERKIKINGKCSYVDGKVMFEVNDGINKVSDFILCDESINNMKERVKEQLYKIKDTIFDYNKLDVDDIYAYIKVKDLNELRRNVLNLLYNKRILTIRNNINNNYKLKLKDDINYNEGKLFNVLVSNKEQLDAVLSSGFKYDSIYIRDYKLYKEYEDKINCKFYLPRVTKRFEKNAVTSNLNNLENAVTSPYLNVNNSYTVAKLIELGAKKIGLSPELSYEKMSDLTNGFEERYNKRPNYEVMIYGYYDAMIMKHCFINKEKGYKNNHCNECKKGLKLTDRMGKEYPLTGDENCNLTVLYYKPVNLFNEVNELFKIGINNFLINFTIEKSNEIIKILSGFDCDCKYKGHYYNNEL